MESDKEFKIEASFALRGAHLDPGLVTNILGIEPTAEHTSGEEYIGRNGIRRVHPWSVWQLSSGVAISSGKEDDHLLYLLSLLESRAEKIAQIRSGADGCDLRIWCEVKGDVASIRLSANLLRRLCALVDDINISVITHDLHGSGDAAT
jgi:hypothetical protein